MPLSRKYRPRFFKDVTGQQHITETLRKEVESGMLGHAYLFSGPRGVGKTTTARIFAKALLNETTDHGEPPVESEANEQIDHGNCIDFIEIDAASNTGVDHVREVIIEHVRFSPARWKRKVYVIDECHMLSTSAWNALLKTLEEPPEYAFFILATTELHKVPETIKSRCQRFEFKRILPDALANRIKELASSEKINIDEDVVQRIVHASDGCLRDAESLMDQLISLGSDRITSEIAELVLPASMLPKTAQLLQKASERKIDESLQYAKQLIEEGMSPIEVMQDLLEAVRMLIRAQDSAERKRYEQGDDGDKAVMSLYEAFSLGELAEIALMLMERRRDIKMGTDPLFALELSLSAIAGRLLPHANPVEHHLQEHEKKAQIKTNSESGAGSRKLEVNNPEVTLTENDIETKITEVHQINTPPTITTEPPVESPLIQESSSNQVEIPNASDHTPYPIPHTPSFDIHDVRKYWSLIIREVEKENHSLPFILKVSQPDRMEGKTIHIRFQYEFHREKLLDDLKTRRIVEGAMRAILKNTELLIDGFCQPKEEEQTNDSLAHAPIDVVSKVLGAFGGQVVE